MKNAIRRLALLLCVLLLCPVLFGCAKNTSQDYYPEAPDVLYDGNGADTAYESDASNGFRDIPLTKPDSSSATPADGGDYSRKLIYTQDITLTADDLSAVIAAFTQRAQALGGYVSDSNYSTDERGIYYATMTLRLPPAALSQMEELASQLGKVSENRLYTEEITNDYWDIHSRLRNAQAQEEQLLALLKECQTVEDTLLVRESLSMVQQEIEVYQGKLRLWDQQVSLSTVELTLRRTASTAVEKTDELLRLWSLEDVWGKMRNGFTNTARFLLNAFFAIFIVLAYLLLPALLLAIPLVIIVLCVRHKRRKKQTRPTTHG